MPDLLWIVMLASTFGQSGPSEVPAPKSVASPAQEANTLGGTQQELNSGNGPRTTDQEPRSSPAGTRRALIVCGHPGNAEFERTYAAVLQGLCKGLAERAGFPAGEILVLSGTKAGDAALPSGTRHGGPATREGIQTAVKELAGKLRRRTRCG